MDPNSDTTRVEAGTTPPLPQIRRQRNPLQIIADLPIIGPVFNGIVSIIAPYFLGLFLAESLRLNWGDKNNLVAGSVVVAWNALLIYFAKVGYWIGLGAGVFAIGCGIYLMVKG